MIIYIIVLIFLIDFFILKQLNNINNTREGFSNKSIDKIYCINLLNLVTERERRIT